MALEQGLFQLIASNSTVNLLVGVDANNTTKMYWVLAPAKTPVPYIVLDRDATSDTYTMHGNSGLRSTLLRVDCYATDYYTSVNIANAVRGVLDAYKGNLPDTNSTAVGAVFVEKDWDMNFEEGGTMKGFVFRRMLQFRVWYYD